VEAFSLLFNWQPTASIVGRPVTELELVCGGVVMCMVGEIFT
jgi:hypothetical protein